jgi:putative DNA modification/repair radical SAM protein
MRGDSSALRISTVASPIARSGAPFLSSGISRNPDYTMEQVVAVARKLRVEHQFRGYIHLKTIPEASPALIEEAGRYADRISINIELPTKIALEELAPQKSFENTDSAMAGIRDRIAEAKAERKSFAPAGQSTQMIVGATDTPDATILDRASSLYEKHRLRRVYYSAFSPIPDASSKLPLVAPPLVREHRLYQADWLIRFYDFKANELTTPAAPSLDLAVDPKLSWALRNRHLFPIDLNKAPRELLLRVPGLGTKAVYRIVKTRRWHKLRTDDLARLHVSVKKVLPFIITADYNSANLALDRADFAGRFVSPDRQLELFQPEPSVLTGQL